MNSFLPLPPPFGLLFRGLSLHLTRSLSSDRTCCLGVSRCLRLPVGEGATATLTGIVLLIAVVSLATVPIAPILRVVLLRMIEFALFLTALLFR